MATTKMIKASSIVISMGALFVAVQNCVFISKLDIGDA